MFWWKKETPTSKIKPRIQSVIYFELFINSTSDWIKTKSHCQIKVLLYQNEKYSFLNVAISNVSSTSVHLIKPPVSRIELLNVKFFPLFSKLGVLIMDLFYHCDQYVAHTVPFAVEVSTCCLCLVVGIDISSMFCKSIFKRSFRLPYILLGALLAPQQIYNVGGGAIYTTVDVSLVVIRCCFYSFPLLDIRTDTTFVVPSHPW